MTWFSENKFIAGLLVFTLLGAGALGYLLFGAKSSYEANKATFDQQAAELSRLEHLPAYPDPQNLEVLESQRVAHLGLIEDLHKSLLTAQIPMEPITPIGFQDQLRAAVTQFTAKAGATPLPANFYLGFNPYQSAPPTPEAAPLLARQLKVVVLVLQKLLDSHVAAITEFKREPFPEESGKKATPEPAKPAGRGAPVAGKNTPPAEPLVKTKYMDISFVIDEQKPLQQTLNALVTTKEQFLITRFIRVLNSNEHGPTKDAAPPEPEPTGTPVSPMKFGEEKITALLRLEMVDFAPLPPAATSTARGSRPTPGK